MTSGQVGKSEILNNIIGYYIEHGPWASSSGSTEAEAAQDYSKRRITDDKRHGSVEPQSGRLKDKRP